MELVERTEPDFNNLISGLYRTFLSTDERRNPNGFTHSNSRRFGGPEILRYLSVYNGQNIQINRREVLLTAPKRKGMDLNKDNIYFNTPIPSNSIVLPRYEVSVEITEPLEIFLPDMLTLLVEFCFAGVNDELLLEIIESYGWQVGVIALASLPGGSDLQRCFDIVKKFGFESRRINVGDLEITTDKYYNWLNLSTPYPDGASVPSESLQKVHGRLKSATRPFPIEKDYFRTVLEIISYLNDSEEWYQKYSLDALQMVPITIKAGFITIIFPSEAEDGITNSFDHTNGRKGRTDFSGIPYKHAVGTISPIPVTFYLGEIECVDFDAARYVNSKRYYSYTIK